jgi:hypothetical protein
MMMMIRIFSVFTAYIARCDILPTRIYFIRFSFTPLMPLAKKKASRAVYVGIRFAIFGEEHVHAIQLNGNAVASNHKGSPMRHTPFSYLTTTTTQNPQPLLFLHSPFRSGNLTCHAALCVVRRNECTPITRASSPAGYAGASAISHKPQARRRPPNIAATSPPDQDIPLDKLKFDVDVDPRRVLSYMYNVTSYFKKCVRECMYDCPLSLCFSGCLTHFHHIPDR